MPTRREEQQRRREERARLFVELYEKPYEELHTDLSNTSYYDIKERAEEALKVLPKRYVIALLESVRGWIEEDIAVIKKRRQRLKVSQSSST
jgi:hypothetical protein